ncbi:MAG: hypothetical protein M0R28_05875 [Pigmentiphaga sp.]|nr:hypothetical protein [Pigmentiphaga sp.]
MQVQNAGEMSRRQEAVNNTIATQRLEGYEIDGTTLDEMQRYARGEASVTELITTLQQRLERGEFGQRKL